jgi:hypothetical protein
MHKVVSWRKGALRKLRPGSSDVSKEKVQSPSSAGRESMVPDAREEREDQPEVSEHTEFETGRRGKRSSLRRMSRLLKKSVSAANLFGSPKKNVTLLSPSDKDGCYAFQVRKLSEERQSRRQCQVGSGDAAQNSTGAQLQNSGLVHGSSKRSNDDDDRDSNLPVDPVLLTPIEADEAVFVYTRPNGSLVTYRAESLIDYFLFTGAFQEPETKLLFSDEDLAILPPSEGVNVSGGGGEG